MSFAILPEKDPNSEEPYFFVWCDKDGTNTGNADDSGELQGATISTSTVTVPSGITLLTKNNNAVTIKGVNYQANTVVTALLSGGIDGLDYDILCRITTSDGRTLDKTMTVPVRQL